MSRLVGPSYQYLQRSKIPTNKFQRSLPRLKIPNLDKTCNRFLAALEPIFPHDSKFETTKLLIKDFSSGQGGELHKALKKYNDTVSHSSYINQFWFDMYLSSRLPLPLNYNPFLSWKDAPTSGENNQVVRSTNFLISAARFRRSLEENVLEPEVFHMNPKSVSPLYKDIMYWAPQSIATYISFCFKAFPLDMSQYKNLFNSTRIPRKGKDIIKKFDSRANRHVLVMKGGQFYTFELYDQNGDLNTPEYIYAHLDYIVRQSKPSQDFLSISELSSADRDFWAAEREHIANISEQNRTNLTQIDSALFVLCLDDVVYQQNQILEGAQNFLHGFNKNGPLNRWFDKSFSIIITRDGHASINFEHSWGDGVAILRFFNDTFGDTTKNPQILEPIKQPESFNVAVKKLDFELDSRAIESIKSSRKQHGTVTSKLELGAVQYSSLNRGYFKKNKLSPDAMSQLSFQLAFKKVYGSTPVTYESCSTAAFRGGRTETVRPCTHETNAAVKAIIENRSTSAMPNSELKELLRKCSQRHFQLCKEASMGDGFDRHLFSLKELALRSGQQLHALYSDPLYLESQHYVLSTSTLYGECFSGGGFAPVVSDGFGLGYGYVDEEFGVLISSYKDSRNNGQFVQALNESLDDIRKIVET